MAKKKTKKLQDDMMASAHKIWLAGLGALAVGQEEGTKLFKTLVDKGAAFESMGKDKVEQAKGTVTGVKTVAESYWGTFEKGFDEKVTAVVHRLGVPTKDEIENLTKKVDELNKTIEKLRKPAPARRPRGTAAKAAPKTTTK